MNPVGALRRWRTPDGKTGTRLYMWCPGCADLHAVEIEGQPRWEWDGNLEAPTVSPSIKVTGVQWAEGKTFHKPTHGVARGEQTVCHSYVKQGAWQFLGDCTHTLGGQVVPLPPLPDWLGGE